MQAADCTHCSMPFISGTQASRAFGVYQVLELLPTDTEGGVVRNWGESEVTCGFSAVWGVNALNHTLLKGQLNLYLGCLCAIRN